MKLSYYAARANLYYLRQHHQEWSPAQLAAVLGYSVDRVKKWLKRFQEELALGKHSDEIRSTSTDDSGSRYPLGRQPTRQ